jgi:hypothetical protein
VIALKEALKIIFGCILAAVVYGIIHDQITARICLEYFTVFHPPIFPTDSPTLLGIGWGIVATWWAGAVVGALLIIAARAGSNPPMAARRLVPWIIRLTVAMALCALIFGVIGYFWAPIPRTVSIEVPASMERRFLAVWWAHNASYDSGFLGGIILCVIVWLRRSKISQLESEGSI